MTALSYGPLAIEIAIATRLGTCVVPSTNFLVLPVRAPHSNLSQAGKHRRDSRGGAQGGIFES